MNNTWTSYQFLFGRLFGTFQGVSQTISDHVLTSMGVWLTTALGIFVIIWGCAVALGNGSAHLMAERFVRATLVIHLSTGALFTQFIVHPLTVELPDTIAQAVGGQGNTAQGGANGSEVFDALAMSLANTSAKARAQMLGYQYIGDRAAVWFIELAGRVENGVSWSFYALARLLLLLVPVLIALTGPLWLFRATESFAGRAAGVGVGMLAMVALTVLVATVVTNVEVEYFGRFASELATTKPGNPDLKIAGDNGALIFTGFSEVGAVGGGGIPEQQTAQQIATLNTDKVLETLIDCTATLFIGVLALASCTAICGAMAFAPFSMSGPLNYVSGKAMRMVGGRR